MKTILVINIIIFTFFHSFCQDFYLFSHQKKIQLEFQKRNKNAEVKACFIYNMSFGSNNSVDSTLKSKIYFDADGKITRRINYETESDSTYTDFFYNSIGLLNVWTSYNLDIYPIHHLIEFNKKGNPDTAFITGADPRKYIFKCNSKDNISEKIGMTANNIDSSGIKWFPVDKYTYFYDKSDNLIKEEFYFNNELSNRILYKYDGKGKLIKKIIGIENHLITIYFIYNKQGLLIEEKHEEGKETNVTRYYYK